MASHREEGTTSTNSKSAVFDDTALQRLNELAEKRKAGIRLTAAEGLELRELRVAKAAAQQAMERAAILKARRALADQTRYRLGGLALAAGLGDWPEELLKVGFARLAALTEHGKAALLGKYGGGEAQPPASHPGTGTPAAPAES